MVPLGVALVDLVPPEVVPDEVAQVRVGPAEGVDPDVVGHIPVPPVMTQIQILTALNDQQGHADLGDPVGRTDPVDLVDQVDLMVPADQMDVVDQADQMDLVDNADLLDRADVLDPMG